MAGRAGLGHIDAVGNAAKLPRDLLGLVAMGAAHVTLDRGVAKLNHDEDARDLLAIGILAPNGHEQAW